MKRLLLEFIFTAIAVIPIFAESSYDAEYEGLYYNYKTVTLSNYETPAIIGAVVAGYKQECFNASSDLVVPGVIDVEEGQFRVLGIGQSAFEGIELNSLTLPTGMIEIGKAAFKNAKINEELVIPSTIRDIYDSQFVEWKNIATPTSEPYTDEGIFDGMEGYGVRFNAASVGSRLVVNNAKFEHFDASQLTKTRLFVMNCPNLKTLKLCDLELMSCHLGNTGQNLERNCYFGAYNCAELCEVEISSMAYNVKECFYKCPKIHKAIFDDGDNSIVAGPLEDDVVYYNLPLYQQEMMISSYTGMFQGNASQIDTLYVGRNFTVMEHEDYLYQSDNHYNKYEGLKHLVFGAGVTNIEEWKLIIYSTQLESIVMKCNEPPYGLENNFQGSITHTATLYVPQGSLSAFKNDPIWGTFENIIELPEDELNEKANVKISL